MNRRVKSALVGTMVSVSSEWDGMDAVERPQCQPRYTDTFTIKSCQVRGWNERHFDLDQGQGAIHSSTSGDTHSPSILLVAIHSVSISIGCQ